MKMKSILGLAVMMVAGLMTAQNAWCVPVSEYIDSSDQGVERTVASSSDQATDHLTVETAECLAANSPSNATSFRAGNFH